MTMWLVARWTIYRLLSALAVAWSGDYGLLGCGLFWICCFATGGTVVRCGDCGFTVGEIETQSVRRAVSRLIGDHLLAWGVPVCLLWCCWAKPGWAVWVGPVCVFCVLSFGLSFGLSSRWMEPVGILNAINLHRLKKINKHTNGSFMNNF